MSIIHNCFFKIAHNIWLLYFGVHKTFEIMFKLPLLWQPKKPSG